MSDVYSELSSVMQYSAESDSGLVWTKNVGSRAKAGAPALLSVNGRGYRNGFYKYQNLLAHRVVWFLHHGYLPKFIDHINGDRLDNRIENLREVTSQENSTNIIGKGYTLTKSGKYLAQITTKGVNVNLGLYSTATAANRAYLRAKAVMHPLSKGRLKG